MAYWAAGGAGGGKGKARADAVDPRLPPGAIPGMWDNSLLHHVDARNILESLMGPLMQRSQTKRAAKKAKNASKDEDFRRVRRAYRRARVAFSSAAPGSGSMQFKRILGWGGFGLVMLWTVRDNKGVDIRDVAIKMALRDSVREARDELEWMLHRFRGREHFVQIVDLSPLISFTDPRLYNVRDTPNPIIVMEVLEKSNLMELIQRMDNAGKANVKLDQHDPDFENRYRLDFIPNRILWRMFKCLARAIVGMAYEETVDFRNPLPIPFHDDPTMIPLAREAFNPHRLDPVDPPEKIIHFDLDIHNIICGDIGHPLFDKEHEVSPIIKLADYGMTTRWKDGWPAEYKERCIQKGKYGFFAPEQRYPFRAALPGFRIGHELNIWAVGQVMFNLLTSCQPYSESWVPRNRMLKMRDGTLKMVMTWGWWFIEDPEFTMFPIYTMNTLDLRHLVARCMADMPEDRPSIEELLFLIDKGIVESDERVLAAEMTIARNGGVVPPGSGIPTGRDTVFYPQEIEREEILTKFYNDLFRSPPVRPDPYYHLWNVITPTPEPPPPAPDALPRRLSWYV
ncbi:kinase-like domain-containing protein [Hypoxylon crocopeplum]|nr:kinase-like domain-containing protein [Hypoxylon crocopeplum]